MLKILIGLAAAASAQMTGAGGTDAGDRQQLEALNSRWLKTLETRDEAALASVLADDFVGLYGDAALSRQQMLDGLKSRPETRVSWQNLTIQVKGDSAVVSAISTIVTHRGSAETTSRYNYADFYSRRDGRWQAVAARVIRLP